MCKKNLNLLLLLFSPFTCFAQPESVARDDFKIGSLILLNNVNTVINMKGKPNNIKKGEVVNKGINLYKYNDFTLYVGENNDTIYAYEINSPSLITTRGINIGDSFKDVLEIYPYSYKNKSFARCGPYDTNFNNYTHYVYYTLTYKEVDNSAWEGKIITFFLKDDVITKIFIYQGEDC